MDKEKIKKGKEVVTWAIERYLEEKDIRPEDFDMNNMGDFTEWVKTLEEVGYTGTKIFHYDNLTDTIVEYAGRIPPEDKDYFFFKSFGSGIQSFFGNRDEVARAYEDAGYITGGHPDEIVLHKIVEDIRRFRPFAEKTKTKNEDKPVRKTYHINAYTKGGDLLASWSGDHIAWTDNPTRLKISNDGQLIAVVCCDSILVDVNYVPTDTKFREGDTVKAEIDERKVTVKIVNVTTDKFGFVWYTVKQLDGTMWDFKEDELEAVE